MARTKTDNDFLSDKVALRAQNLPVGEVRVLDCYAGKGVVWECVKRITGREIQRLPIDSRNDMTEFHLHGDNRGFLESLDLSRFNIVDLDAYGIPYDQISALYRRGFVGRVFVTFISSYRGGVCYDMLEEIGFTKAMIEKAPSLFARRGREYFLQYLAKIGVGKITHRSKRTNGFSKTYGFFDLNVNGAVEHEADSGIPQEGTFANPS